MHQPLLGVALLILLAACAAAPTPVSPPERSVVPGTIGALAVPVPGGLRIDALAAEGPAARAGLQVGDVVWRCAGKPVATTRQFNQLVLDTRPGEKLHLDVRRDEQELELQVDVMQLRTALRL
jgi:S1-C subfamily serine protease